MHSPQGFSDNRLAAARAFARSLNILLKCVRLYGADHKLTSAQFTTAWSELRAALPTDPNAGFLLGVSGQKLLVDGVPLECGPAERGFAQLLSAAGVASIQFTGKMNEAEFLGIVQAFAKGGTKAAGAGVAGHVHMHMLPRWTADSNFMGTVGETRVLPEALEDTYQRLKERLGD